MEHVKAYPTVMKEALDSMNYWFLKRIGQEEQRDDAEIGRFLVNLSDDESDVPRMCVSPFLKEMESQDFVEKYASADAFRDAVQQTVQEILMEVPHETSQAEWIVHYYTTLYQMVERLNEFETFLDVVTGQAEWTDELREQVAFIVSSHSRFVSLDYASLFRAAMRRKNVGQHFGGDIAWNRREKNGLQHFSEAVENALALGARSEDTKWLYVSNRMKEASIGRYAEIENSHPLPIILCATGAHLAQANRLMNLDSPCSKEQVKEFESFEPIVGGSVFLGYLASFDLRGEAAEGYHGEVSTLSGVTVDMYEVADGDTFPFDSEDMMEEEEGWDVITQENVVPPNVEVIICVKPENDVAQA